LTTPKTEARDLRELEVGLESAIVRFKRLRAWASYSTVAGIALLLIVQPLAGRPRSIFGTISATLLFVGLVGLIATSGWIYHYRSLVKSLGRTEGR
jgi:hypothetical protein